MALEAARVLLERGANLSIPNKDGNTCLHCATYDLNIDMITLLFEYGADDTILNVCLFILLKNNNTSIIYIQKYIYIE